jgi:LmbE family N-acetylglucosaminyl deacetylase
VNAAQAMRLLNLGSRAGAPLRVLCLGAHADDIEIGCGGMVLTLALDRGHCEFHWVVLSADATREREARKSAGLFLKSVRRRNVVVKNYRDSFFPFQGADIKEYFEELKRDWSPDLIFTHYRDDRHQDHCLISDLTWNTFRDHLILEYEVPKYDGDLGRPNCFVPLTPAMCERKIRYLLSSFESQRAKRWFTAETFRGLMRLRGVESAAPGGYAEAFHGHKLVLGA